MSSTTVPMLVGKVALRQRRVHVPTLAGVPPGSVRSLEADCHALDSLIGALHEPAEDALETVVLACDGLLPLRDGNHCRGSTGISAKGRSIAFQSVEPRYRAEPPHACSSWTTHAMRASGKTSVAPASAPSRFPEDPVALA